MGARMALCPRDGTPLICTFAFSGAEFYCLDCGSTYGWFGPDGAEPTPELDARLDALKAEWQEHAGRRLIGGGIRFSDCATCQSEHEPHMRHATIEEKAGHEAALAWLIERRSVAA